MDFPNFVTWQKDRAGVKQRDKVMKIPVIDLSECVDCDVCIETCPAIFRRNAAGYIEVFDLSEYPEEEVAEAIKNCPANCITWEEV